MRYRIWLVLSLPVFVWGCGPSESEPQATPDSSTSTDRPAQVVSADEVQASRPSKTKFADPKTQLTADLAQLMHTAARLELAGQYAEAMEAWKQVHQRVSQEYGLDSWQARNAELSIGAARRRSEFDIADRVIALEIGDLERQADIDRSVGKLPQACTGLGQALVKAESLWGAESLVVLNLKAKLASFASLMGDDQRALYELTSVAHGREKLLGRSHPDTLQTLQDLSAIHQRMEQYDQAVQWATGAIEVATELYGDKSVEAAKQRNNLGVILYSAGDYQRALKHLNAALDLRTELLGATAPEVAHCMNNIGLTKLAMGQPETAASDFNTAIEVLINQPEEYAALATAHVQLGTVYMVLNDFPAAEAEFRETRQILDQHRDELELQLADACFKLGVALGKQGKYPSAEIQLRDALEIQRRAFPQGHPQLAKTEEIYTLVQSKIATTRTGQRPGTLQR